MASKTKAPSKAVIEQHARITVIKEAMLNGAAMSINGIAGQWNTAGDVWTADDPSVGNTLILVRISDAEEEEVNGVARQIEDTCNLTARRGARVGMILVENDTSAFKRRKIELPNGETQLRTVRPKFRRALKLLSEGRFRRFTTYHLDRTVRDPRDLEDLIDVVEGSRPRIIADSFTGSLRLANDSDITSARIHCAIANQASRDTVRRVSRTRKQQAQEGRFGGGRRRYGFEPDGTTHRPQEADAIARYHAIALTGVSVKEIARDMNAAGLLTTTEKPWTSQLVRPMLLRPCIAGLSVHRAGVPVDLPQEEGDEEGEEEIAAMPRHYTPDDVVGTLPGDPIVDPDDYWRLVNLWTDPDRYTTLGNTPQSLGSCIYRCPCGGTVTTQNKKWKRKDPKTGEVIRIDVEEAYRCPGFGKGHVVCQRAELDALVTATIKELIRISDPADIIGHPTTAEADIPALRAEMATHEARLREISADREADLISRAQMIDMTAKRRKKMEATKAKLDQALEDVHPAAKLIGAEDIDAAWDALTLGEQREICRRMLVVTIQPLGRGRRAPVRERVTITKRHRDAQTT
ncbi:recombinase family protein [Streptosporangium amethystogenes]|uniref:recombinase family protein n=1 Tax=Streptosporangium amethystogenes TaxID=2002 RepID=UPI0009FD12B1|nr:recombinase family protein [Streptosporangium amethystogenes]